MTGSDPLAVRSSTAAYIAKNSLLRHCGHMDVAADPVVISTRVNRGGKSDYVLIDELANTQYQAENDFFWSEVVVALVDTPVLAASLKDVLTPSDTRNLGPSFLVFPTKVFPEIRASLNMVNTWGFDQVVYAGIAQGNKVFTLDQAEHVTVFRPGAIVANVVPTPLEINPDFIRVSSEIKLVLRPEIINQVEVPHG